MKVWGRFIAIPLVCNVDKLECEVHYCILLKKNIMYMNFSASFSVCFQCPLFL